MDTNGPGGLRLGEPAEDELEMGALLGAALADDDPAADPADERIVAYEPDQLESPPEGWPAETERG